MNDFNEERMAYFSIPDKNTLRCIICEVNFMKIRDLPLKSSYHWQIFKCRTIIQTIKEVIASPIFGTTGSIYVIATSELIESCQLKTQLHSLDVLYGKSQAVTVEIYTMCINYTIKYRISPLWNNVGQYYVYGLELGVNMKEFNGLKLKISINGKNAQFHFSATKIKIPFAQLEDFDLIKSSTAEFLADNNGIINLTNYCLSVHILPSMKVGRVVFIFKRIPSHCPFTNYYQLRKYWIDMYDYYLPQTDEGIIYYEIKFLSDTSSFIYPSVCVTTGPISLFPCINVDDIISQFIYDLSGALNEICNKQIYIYKNKEQDHQLTQLKNQNAVKIYSQDDTRSTSINLCKSSDDRKLSSVKKTSKGLNNQLEIYTNHMKFKRNEQTNVISSNNLPRAIQKICTVKMKKSEVDENVTPFFKETNPNQILYEKPQLKPRLTLKQKLSNAMYTTNL